MRRKIWNKSIVKKAGAVVTAAIMTCLLALESLAPVAAASVENATIDRAKKGSLTIYKYDVTRAEENGVTESFVTAGRADTEAENVYGPYAIQGVEFTCLKIGETETYSAIDSQSGSAEVKVLYGISDETAKVLKVPYSDMEAQKDNLVWFASDTLIKALSELIQSGEAAAKNTLEHYVTSNRGIKMQETNQDGMTKASDLPLGLYLVVETAVPENVVSTVNPFLVSIPMTDIGGDNWNYDVVTYPKNQTGNPTLEKSVAEVTSAKGNVLKYEDTATASDGDVVAYQIISTLPKITSKATWLTAYTFVDQLSDGIVYNKGDVSLTWYDENKQEVAKWTQKDKNAMFRVKYTVNKEGGSKMEITMTKEGLAAINPAFSQYTVVIDYQCTLRSDDLVVYGDNGNPNYVTLTWKRTNMEYYDTLNDDCLVYTYGLALTKKFAGGMGNYENVRFVVKNNTDGYYITARKETDGVYYVTGAVGAGKEDATVFQPDKEGNLLIYGLENDVYVATELETDTGYLLLKDDIEIRITSTKGPHCRTGSAAVDSNAVTMSSSDGSANALAPLAVVNERGYDIPKTGDTNTFLFPVLGLTGAAGLTSYIMLGGRKKKKK